MTPTIETLMAAGLSAAQARMALATLAAPPSRKSGTPRECACGCGGTTRGGTWLPGHDAKHYSRVLAAARSGMTAAPAPAPVADAPRLVVLASR